MTADTQALAPTLRELIDLDGKTAIVTGGGRGIGRGIAGRLHEAGARVVLSGRDALAIERVAAELNAVRVDSAHAVIADIGDRAAVDAMVGAAVDRFGALDILVNNAGVFPLAEVVEIEPQTFRSVIDINVTGTFRCTQAAARQMIRQGRGGAIINITSVTATDHAFVGLAHYTAAKHAIWGFTKNVARELAPHRIRVNAVAPGAIHASWTGFDDGSEPSDEARRAAEEVAGKVPLRRFGYPEEIGRVAVFLASDMASYMTGSQVLVDGGLLLA